MRRFTLLFLAIASLALAGVSGFNLAVDPYDVTGGRALHLNRTRRKSDGRRVWVGFEALKPHRTLLAGDSRISDGFGDVEPPWGGDVLNAGLPSGNAFELGRVLVVQARHGVDCVVLGLDPQDYDQLSRIKGAYWLSPLLDGSPELATLRMATSRTTFDRSVETLEDNAKGRGQADDWPSLYKPGQQLRMFDASAEDYRERFAIFAYDRERVRFISEIADRLTQRGVQVIGLFTPLHAFGSEAVFRSGRAGDVFAFRRDMVEALDRFSARRPKSACVPGGAVVLWDFWGFQPFSTPPLPAPDQTRPHPTFYEAAHFTPTVGAAILRRMAGRPVDEPFAEPFGMRVDSKSLAADEQAILARRAAWLATPQGRTATAWFDGMEKRAQPLPVSQRLYLSRDDWRMLDRDLPRLGSRTEDRFAVGPRRAEAGTR